MTIGVEIADKSVPETSTNCKMLFAFFKSLKKEKCSIFGSGEELSDPVDLDVAILFPSLIGMHPFVQVDKGLGSREIREILERIDMWLVEFNLCNLDCIAKVFFLKITKKLFFCDS